MRDILCNDTHVAAHIILKPASEGADDACAKPINKAAQDLWCYENSGLAHHRALQDWDVIIDRSADCQKCVALLKARAAREQCAIWDKLPKMFGVPYTLKA